MLNAPPLPLRLRRIAKPMPPKTEEHHDPSRGFWNRCERHRRLVVKNTGAIRHAHSVAQSGTRHVTIAPQIDRVTVGESEYDPVNVEKTASEGIVTCGLR